MILVENHLILAWSGCDVAGLATGILDARVAVIFGRNLLGFWPLMAGIAFGRLAMHLRFRMAIDTIHAPLAEMNICQQTLVLTQEFISHPAAMAGRAVTSHGRGFRE